MEAENKMVDLSSTKMAPRRWKIIFKKLNEIWEKSE